VTGGDRQDPRKYVRLAGLLRRDIEDGTLAASQPAPTISQLTQGHCVSRDTARHALRVLEADKLVWYVPGRGYYVR
jgi:DNA-binding GntR family transcriptional regulator